MGATETKREWNTKVLPPQREVRSYLYDVLKLQPVQVTQVLNMMIDNAEVTLKLEAEHQAEIDELVIKQGKALEDEDYDLASAIESEINRKSGY